MRISKKMMTALAIALALMAAPTKAQQPTSTPEVDPEAIARLDSLAAYLRTLKSFQVEAMTTTEEVLEDGQKVQFAGVTNALARIPDRLRISVKSDRRDRLYIYDGKEFTMFARRVNYYVTAPAPPTIGQLADELDDKHGIGLPLEDLFRWGAPQEKTAISKRRSRRPCSWGRARLRALPAGITRSDRTGLIGRSGFRWATTPCRASWF